MYEAVPIALSDPRSDREHTRPDHFEGRGIVVIERKVLHASVEFVVVIRPLAAQLKASCTSSLRPHTLVA